MFRYVAFVWNDAESAARETAQQLAARLQGDWRLGLKQNGLAVFHAGARAGSSESYLLHNGAGVVLGKLFKSSDGGRSISASLTLSEAESAKILATQGRHLIEEYWGRYVAFARNTATDSTWVLRDSSAVLPCHAVSFNGVEVYFSLMEDALRLGVSDFSVNWKYVAAALCHMRLQLHETGLQGVSQVLGGERVELRQGRVSRSFLWDPLRVAESDVFEDSTRAAEALRSSAHDCVQAWASCYRGIVHTLSGGLDSSIVMACLQDMPSPPRITCVNYHSEGADGDERSFAQLSAQRAGQGLIERERNPDVSFGPLLHMQKSSAPPAAFLYYLDNNRTDVQLAAEHNATAIFSGNTGDQLFYQAFAGFAAGDYISRHGFRSPLTHIAMDAARMDRASVWSVLRDGIKQGVWGRHWSPSKDVGKYRQLLSPDAVKAAENIDFIHPQFRAPSRYPSGKLFHAYSLIFPPDFYTPLGQPDDAELVSPLYSQPLIETALRIPTYILTQGGWDRAAARRAFQNEVPREIITRQTKGGVEEHAKWIFLRNISLVRELLLDGGLVREGILDRKKLHEALSGEPTRVASGSVELYDYVGAEAWLRLWGDARERRVAA